MTDKWVNYTESGYDERDGLDLNAGRWMYDDKRMTRVWVRTIDPERRCGCGRKIGPRAKSCNTCWARARRQAVAA